MSIGPFSEEMLKEILNQDILRFRIYRKRFEVSGSMNQEQLKEIQDFIAGLDMD